MSSIRIGVISDTHGVFDDVLRLALAGSDHIVHAGDVGGLDIVQQLAMIAPVTAVRGNMDHFPGADELSAETLVSVGERRILVAHIREMLLRFHDPCEEGVDVVVTGHTHKAAVAWDGDVLYLNPGSAGAAHMGAARTMAVLTIEDRRMTPEIVSLSGA